VPQVAKELMRRHGLNARQLADLIGVRHETVRRWLVDPSKPSFCRPSSAARTLMQMLVDGKIAVVRLDEEGEVEKS